MHRLARGAMDLHTAVYRATRGWIGGRAGRLRMLLLTTRGRRTGRERTAPLVYFEDPSPSVREAVAGWLRRRRSVRWTPAELDTLVRLMHDESAQVSGAAWGTFQELPTVQYTPPIQDPELVRAFGSRAVFVDPLSEAALQGLLESATLPNRRVILAQVAPKFPAAVGLRLLAALAKDRDQDVLRAVEDAMSTSLVAEDPAVRDGGDVALQDVEIRAADRDGVDPNDCIGVVAQRWLRDLFPLLLTGSVIDERLHLAPPS